MQGSIIISTIIARFRYLGFGDFHFRLAVKSFRFEQLILFYCRSLYRVRLTKRKA